MKEILSDPEVIALGGALVLEIVFLVIAKIDKSNTLSGFIVKLGKMLESVK